jgi:hypothetical protein
MDALVLGRPGIERTRLEQLLAAADVTVTVCHDGRWGCVGMDGECPLDALDVDVAVAVADPSDRFDPQGIACVHRARIPIVAVGATEHDPVLEYATRHVPRADASVVDIVRAAARDATGHLHAIETAIASHLRSGEHAQVAVNRSATSVHVTIDGRFDRQRAAAFADVARAAARDHDPHVDVIDVSVVPPSAM